MRFEFRQGVPQEAVAWLKMNIPSNTPWNILREAVDRDNGYLYIPCVYIHDEQLAIMFALMWLDK